MFTNIMFFFIVFMFFSGLFVYSFNLNHFLVLLMSLEFMILSLFMLIFYYLMFCSFESFILLYFLILSVSESVLGMSLLVGLVRSSGNDLYQLKC